MPKTLPLTKSSFLFRSVHGPSPLPSVYDVKKGIERGAFLVPAFVSKVFLTALQSSRFVTQRGTRVGTLIPRKSVSQNEVVPSNGNRVC